MIRTFIVDDENLAKRRLVELLKEFHTIEIIGCASTAREAIQCISRTKPDLVFLDIELGSHSGFDVLDEIRNKGNTFKVIFVTAYSQYAIKALRKKALDYLLKPVDLDDLKRAIQEVHACLESGDLPQKIERLEFLTPQEKRVICQLVNGKTSKKIADILSISPLTVDTHRRRILKKMGVDNTVKLTTWLRK